MTEVGRRTELDGPALRAATLAPVGGYAAVDVVAEIGSTNTELVRRARDGAADRTALFAEHQSAGRGRNTRRWVAPERSGLAVSVLLRPTCPPARFGWVPLLTGLAVHRAVTGVGALTAGLKWPNDLMIDGRKAAGILAEIVPGPELAVVVGVGLNVALTADELPVPQATSLLIAGAASTDRTALAVEFLRALDELARRWDDAGGDPERSGIGPDYRRHCTTLGAAVSVELPIGEVLRGLATDVDPDGRLIVQPERGGPPRALSAGDVTHLRPT